MLKNEEYDILIRAPLGQSDLCLFLPAGTCQNRAEFDLFFRDDRDKVIKQYNDICAKHFVIALIEGISI